MNAKLLYSPDGAEGSNTASNANDTALRKQLAETNRTIQTLQGELKTTNDCLSRVTAENNTLRETNAKQDLELRARAAADKQRAEEEALILEKMRVGLSRPQAIAVIEKQRLHKAARSGLSA
jgi:phage-related tail protein